MRIGTIVLMSVVGIGAAAWAAEPDEITCGASAHHQRAHHGPGRPFAMVARIMEELDLSIEQKDAVDAVINSHWESFRLLRQASRTLHESLMSVSPDDNEYTWVVQEAAEDAATLARRRVQLMAEVRIQLRALLTDEQKGRLDALREERLDQPVRFREVMTAL